MLLLPKPWKDAKDDSLKDEVEKYVESFGEINKKAKAIAPVF